MSQKYAIDKIKKALESGKGNVGQARQIIMAQAMQDPQLMKELVKPHMAGIVAHAVGRVQRGATEPEAVPQQMQKAKAPASNDEKDTFGLDILKSIAGGDSVQFGQEAYGRPMGKRGVSKSHIEAIKAMAKKTQADE